MASFIPAKAHTASEMRKGQEPHTFTTTPSDYLPDPADPHPYGVYLKDLPELRRLAVPIARFMIEHGMLDGEVLITTTRVDVNIPHAGAPFTDEDEAEIFRDPATRA